MTDRERVERALRQRGPHGVTQVDFDAPDVIDGGKPIKRVAARIHELRAQGFAIDGSTWRDGCRVYVLGTDQSRAIVDSVLGPAPQAEPDAPAQLFAGVQVGRGQRSAIFGLEDEAA